jgi:hypothetical protein
MRNSTGTGTRFIYSTGTMLDPSYVALNWLLNKNKMKKIGVSNSVGCGSHRFDAGHMRLSILMPIQIRIRLCIIPQIFYKLENMKFFTFIHSSASFHCSIFLVSGQSVTIFNILDSVPVLEFSREKYGLTRCGCGSCKTMPIRPVRIRIHNTSFNYLSAGLDDPPRDY